MRTIYDALRESHEIQRSLCRCLIWVKPESGKRESILEDLRIELAAHAASEERFLYAPMLMEGPGSIPPRDG